jgi:hypothetical protein
MFIFRLIEKRTKKIKAVKTQADGGFREALRVETRFRSNNDAQQRRLPLPPSGRLTFQGRNSFAPLGCPLREPIQHPANIPKNLQDVQERRRSYFLALGCYTMRI